MLEECVRDSKPLPDYSRSDTHEVGLTLHGDVQDASFIRYLKALEVERSTPFSSHEYLVLDMVRRGVPIPKDGRAVLQSLKSDGVIESQGRDRGTRYVLTRRIDDHAGGAHPLDRQALKVLLRDYLRTSGADGSSLSELLLEFQPLTRDRAQSLLRELTAEGAVHSRGRTKSGRWYFGKGER